MAMLLSGNACSVSEGRPERSGTRQVNGWLSPNCFRTVSCSLSQPCAAWNWYRCSTQRRYHSVVSRGVLWRGGEEGREEGQGGGGGERRRTRGKEGEEGEGGGQGGSQSVHLLSS